MVVRAGSAEDRTEDNVLCSESLYFAGNLDLAQTFRKVEFAFDLGCVRDHFKEIVKILITDLVEHFQLLFLGVRNKSAQFSSSL